jgi:hypothetical protein
MTTKDKKSDLRGSENFRLSSVCDHPGTGEGKSIGNGNIKQNDCHPHRNSEWTFGQD